MCLILEGGLVFSSSAFPLWDRNTGRLLRPGNHSLFSQKDKYYLYFLFFPIYCIVPENSGKTGRQTAEILPSPVTWWMTSHIPGLDTKRGHRRLCWCFQMLKRAITYSLLSFLAQDELPHAGPAWADLALPWSIPLQEHGQYKQERWFFCVLSSSPVNILPDVLNAVTTEHLSATEKRLFPDLPRSSGQRMLCALSFPFSFLLLFHDVHSRPSTFTVSPYIPREHPTYATHAQPNTNPFKPKHGRPRTACRCDEARWGGENSICSEMWMKGSWLDGFPCMSCSFFLSQLLIIQLKDGKWW